MIYLPTGVASIRFLARPDERIFSHCVVRPGGNLGTEFLTADIRLLDEEGNVACELLGFQVKLVAGEADREARENPGDLLYDVTWIAKRAAAQRNSNGSAAGAVFLVYPCRSRRRWPRACRSASVAGAELHCHKPGLIFVAASSLSIALNVVHLSSLDLRDLAARPDAILEAQAQWIDTLQFVQSLLREANASKRRLWIVTRGAQAAGPAPAHISLAQTPLWGLAKSIDLEHAELGCTRIDLDPEGGPEELAALSEELSLNSTEREVAFRKGTRYVARLVPRAPKLSSGAVLDFPEADSFRLDISRPGNLDNLLLRGTSRPEPQPGEVEIRVNAAGLNFRDVMNAAGVYPGGPIPFGAECCGNNFRHRVAMLRTCSPATKSSPWRMAASAAFTTADARAVVPKPPSFSFGQAATIPIAFLTAYYSLHHLAKLSRGERVLIHAAAGGVGLAAVQLAQQAGAEIFATAGSPEKRAYLKSMRVPHIMDSRSLLFRRRNYEDHRRPRRRRCSEFAAGRIHHAQSFDSCRVWPFRRNWKNGYLSEQAAGTVSVSQ